MRSFEDIARSNCDIEMRCAGVGYLKSILHIDIVPLVCTTHRDCSLDVFYACILYISEVLRIEISMVYTWYVLRMSSSRLKGTAHQYPVMVGTAHVYFTITFYCANNIVYS